MAWRVTNIKEKREDYGMDLRGLTCAMKKLAPKEEFNNFLDNTYDSYKINGAVLLPSQILRDAAPGTYFELFNEYVKEVAQDIFENCPEDPDHVVEWNGLKIEWLDGIYTWKEYRKYL